MRSGRKLARFCRFAFFAARQFWADFCAKCVFTLFKTCDNLFADYESEAFVQIHVRLHNVVGSACGVGVLHNGGANARILRACGGVAFCRAQRSERKVVCGANARAIRCVQNFVGVGKFDVGGSGGCGFRKRGDVVGIRFRLRRGIDGGSTDSFHLCELAVRFGGRALGVSLEIVA